METAQLKVTRADPSPQSQGDGEMVIKSKRRLIKRGGRRNKKSNVFNSETWTIYQSNIRGYVSKCVSFENIISNISPSLIVLNETQFRNQKKMKIPGFNSFTRNRQGKCMGGISTSVANKDSKHTLKVAEGANEDEFLITRHSQFVAPINCVNIYGEQEGRCSKDDIENRWNRILNEIIKIEAKDEFVLLLGDLNKHVGDCIEGNHDKVTFGGQLIRNMLSTEKYILINGSKKAVGGPFTRYDPSDPACNEKKSCLDLFIISKELMKYVDNLTIDSNLIITASRPVSRNKLVYPDHYSSLLVFKNIPLKTSQSCTGPKFTLWNTNKEGGWKKYKTLSEDNSKFKEVAEDMNANPDELMTKISKELNRIKYISFGKVKIRKKPKVNKVLEQLQEEKIKCFEEMDDNEERNDKVQSIEKEMAKNLLMHQRVNFEKELENMKEMRKTKGKAAVIFNLKEKIVGEKKSVQEATVLIDHESKKEVYTPEEIKRVSIEYCQKLLTNREPKAEYKEDLELKKDIHRIRMEENIANDVEFSNELFQNSLNMLEKKTGSKYAFILKSGVSLKNA